MRVLYVIDYQPNIAMIRKSVGLDVPNERINWSWQLLEAYGLSKYCNVFLVSKESALPSVKPNIVYSSCDSNAYLGYQLAQHYKVPFVCQVISRIPEYDDPEWNRTKQILNESNALIGVSPVVFRSLVENYPHIPSFMNYHGVNDEIADTIPNFKERKGYVTVARLMKHKRIDLLIEAFCRLWKEKELVIIGDGPEKAELEILNHILCEPAEFIGITDEYTKFYYIKKSKAYLSASEGEQFCIPLAEALYCRTPVIVYELENIKEIYRDGYGSIFYFKTKDELIDIIQKFDKMSDEKIAKLGEKGRKYIVNNGITLSERSKRLYEILMSVLEGSA